MSEPEASLRASIVQAFAGTPRPSDDDLVITPPGDDPECDELAANLKGRSWREISKETIQYHADSLPLLTPSAFRHYLPGYMLASLEPPSAGFDAADVMAFVLLRLIPPESPEDPAYFMARAGQFSLKERQAVASYLELVAQRQQADWAGNVPDTLVDNLARAIHFWQSAGDR